MRLTVFSEYALLVLTFLARRPDRFVTIAEIAAVHGISANHLMKVVQHLVASGNVVTLRGPRGGLRLARPAAEIRIGDVVRATEPKTHNAPCAGRVSQPGHTLPSLLDQAMQAFMAILDGCTVASLLTPDDTSSDTTGAAHASITSYEARAARTSATRAT
jgi:Rrf2 family nitric oxide-sensitive transcriptional repressor